MPARIISFNALGLGPRLPLLSDATREHDADIILVQETLLTARRRASIPGYQHYRINRSEATRGLSIYIKRTLKHSERAVPPMKNLHIQAVEVEVEGSPLVVVNVYNSPNSDSLDRDDLETALQLGPRVLLAGDLNAKHPAWQSAASRGSHRNRAGKTLYEHQLTHKYQIIAPAEPTRTDPRTGNTSTLDIAINKDIPHLIEAESLAGIGSDHNPVLFTVHAAPQTTPPIRRLNYKKADWQRFQREVHDNLSISRFNSVTEIDEGVHHITTTIQDAMAAAIPVTTTNTAPDRLPAHLQNLKMIKNKARNKWINNGHLQDRETFHLAKRELENGIRTWQSQKWSNTLTKVSNHTDVWKLAKALKRQPHNTPPLATPAGTAHSAQEKAEAISDHFENVHKQNDHMGNPGDAQTFEAALTRYLRTVPIEPIKLTTPAEIKGIIKTRHPRKAPGLDGIQNVVLQNLPKKALAYITVLFNACFLLQYFPVEWKHANILPFPKPGKDNKQPQNYRPISLLSAISKVLERIIYRRLMAYLNKEETLNHQQFGFRPKHSTTHQITRLTEYITEGFNMDMHTGVVLLDASAAFDTVWTAGLLYKMAQMKCPAWIIRLLQSYLTNRSFHVTLEGARSQNKKIANGTPQGSILGPILFLLYVNDIPRIGRALLAQYADDTAAFYRAKNLPELVARLQRALDALLEYFFRWRIKINTGKTEAVLFSKRHLHGADDHQLRAGTTTLPWLPHARFLGVILDRKLTFTQHVKTTQKKANAALSIIYPMICRRSPITPEVKTRLATAYVQPILTYASPAWAGIASDTNLYKLQVIQNKYIRTALDLPRHTNMTEAHKNANIKHIGDLILEASSTFFQKCRDNPNPHVAALGAITPETAHYRIKHKTPNHRLLQRDA
jgi:endonuclease/exonuclease/phosphatase (EEP) superfamily protein YafD